MTSDFLAILFPSSVLTGERHAEPGEERVRVRVACGAGCYGDVEAADVGDRVVVDLRKNDLLADPERVVAASVERAGVEPTEVADAWKRDRDETVEELPHARAAERDAGTD